MATDTDGEEWIETGRDPGHVRLVECPFCGASLNRASGHTNAANHLERCEAFFEAWGPDAE